jgi:serine/threonine protein kinase
MPYHAKNSLEALICRHGPLDWCETLRIGVKLAGALDAAHRAGILHRDVKPGNILLTEYGEAELTDFGIARIAGGFRTATGIITGSPAFTAPEVLEGKTPTAASDVFPWGNTVCALTGHAAFERRSGERLVAQFLRITAQPIPALREQGFPADHSDRRDSRKRRSDSAGHRRLAAGVEPPDHRRARFLLEHGCHHLPIILTSWSRAGLPVSKLRLLDELVEIDCDLMRFDVDEARSLLNDVDGLQLSVTDVAALTTSTGGWVAAL